MICSKIKIVVIQLVCKRHIVFMGTASLYLAIVCGFFSLENSGTVYSAKFGHLYAPMLHGIAVLDTAGNLILKMGQYGNEDSKEKNCKEPLGGDEAGLFHPCFVATHTDRRLFISDIGNENIISVKLNYEVNEVLLFK